MRSSLKLSILSFVLFFGIIGFIHAKADSSQQLFGQVATQNANIQFTGAMNAQQLTTILQQFVAPSGGNPGTATATIPAIIHRASGNFNPGGTIILDVIGGPSMANLPFLVAFSFTGDYPGLDLSFIGIRSLIPLNPPYLTISGMLDATGHATINLPIPRDNSLMGLPLTSAALVFNTFSQQVFVSNPASYTIGTGIVGVSCCTEGVLGSPQGQCIDNGVSVEYCRYTVDGAVQNCLPDEPQSASLGINISNVLPAVNATLIDAVMRDVINSSISNRTYVPRSVNATNPYICHHFAGDLEIFLTGRGYNATFTHFMQFDNNNRTTNDHALTDVHFSDGTILFIEPQTGRIVNLDIDGDGRVEARMYPSTHQNGYHPTDDNAKITVYDSKASAAAAGLTMP